VDAASAEPDASSAEPDAAVPGVDTLGTTDALPSPQDASSSDAGLACSGLPGTFHAQVLSSGDEDRVYFLHVPDAYRCGTPWPVLVDFHGTATDTPEEAYGLADATQLADAAGVILLRPRSRSSVEGGSTIYRWDQNPGDLDRNAAFTEALLDLLESRYSIDPARIYALGFSSGTNMVAQFLGDHPSVLPRRMSGYAFVGGGLWSDPGAVAFPADRPVPRVYAVSGYHDYLLGAERALLWVLDGAGHPADHRFIRRDQAGHDLYGWHYRELWPWLDRGVRPPIGTLSATRGWAPDPAFVAADDLLDLRVSAAGDVWLTTAAGTIWQRPSQGPWTMRASFVRPAAAGGAPALESACLLGSGAGVATGEEFVARTTDGGQSWAMAPMIPEFGTPMFGASYLNGLDCAGRRILGGGYWTGVHSDDGGATWQGSPMLVSFGALSFAAQVAAVRIGTASAAVSAGYYDYLGYSDDGVNFTASAPPVSPEWWNALAFAPPAHFWAAGDRGAIVSSDDGGRTWVDRSLAATAAPDLYAIDFWDAELGLAVGAHGAAFWTADGGAHWTDVSTGLDRYLGAARFVNAHRALVAGEAGLMLTLDR
jgi:poly(3-hydroxybutyrate) depolymerase/photosystem II stability/assembly factor-like uncharacterized protein